VIKSNVGVNMAFVVDSDTYMTLVEANEIVEEELLSDSSEAVVWGKLSSKDKEILIKKATKLVDKVIFLGTRAGGLMEWPRYINNKLTQCPTDVKIAIILQALRPLVENNEENKMQELGIKSYSVEGSSVSFSDKYKVKTRGVYTDIFQAYLEKITF